MNPFERKVVHDVVAEAGLVSESEGEEPERLALATAYEAMTAAAGGEPAPPPSRMPVACATDSA